MRALGSANRRPGVPAQRSTDAIEAARPRQSVEIGQTHVLHRVVDRETGRDHAAGRVDVQHDLFVRVFALEIEHLRDHDVRDVVVDLRPEKHDPVFQEPRKDVPRALTAVRGLNDLRVRNETAACVVIHASMLLVSPANRNLLPSGSIRLVIVVV